MTVLRRKRWQTVALKACHPPIILTSSLAVCFLLATFLGVTAQAANESLSRFFGEYRGTGITEGDGHSFGISVRGLDVTIEPGKKSGFKVRWSALIRSGDETDPRYRLKLAEVTFAPLDRPGLYKAIAATRPEAGEWIGWARVSGDGMTVYQLLLDDSGGFQLTSHERTLTEIGMKLRFVRRESGGVVRVVTGELEKMPN